MRNIIIIHHKFPTIYILSRSKFFEERITRENNHFSRNYFLSNQYLCTILRVVYLSLKKSVVYLYFSQNLHTIVYMNLSKKFQIYSVRWLKLNMNTRLYGIPYKKNCKWDMQLKKIKNWYNPLTRETSTTRVNVIVTSL